MGRFCGGVVGSSSHDACLLVCNAMKVGSMKNEERPFDTILLSVESLVDRRPKPARRNTMKEGTKNEERSISGNLLNTPQRNI